MQHFTPPSLQGPRNLQHLPVPVHARQQPALVQALPRRLRRDEHPVALVAGKFPRGRVARFRLLVQVGPVHPANAPALGQLHQFRVGPPCPRKAQFPPAPGLGRGWRLPPSGPATCARPEATHRGYQSIHPASCRRRPILTGAGPAAFACVPFGGWLRRLVGAASAGITFRSCGGRCDLSTQRYDANLLRCFEPLHASFGNRPRRRFLFKARVLFNLINAFMIIQSRRYECCEQAAYQSGHAAQDD